MDGTLSGVTPSEQRGPDNNDNAVVLYIHQSSKSEASPSRGLVLYQDTPWIGLTPLQMCNWCILQFQLTGIQDQVTTS